MVQQPQQARSHRALHRIYKSASKLLSERTFEKITVKEIALHASVSVGTIYQRFETKDALLCALYDHYISKAEKRIDRLVADPSIVGLEERIAQLVYITSGLFSEWRGVIRSMHLRQQSNSIDIGASEMGRIEEVYKKMVHFLAGRVASGCDHDAAKLAISTLLSLSREYYIYGPTQPVELSFCSDESEFAGRLRVAVGAVFQGWTSG